MTSYLDHDAHRIRACLPDGVSVPANSEILFRLYAALLRAKGADTQLSDVHDAWAVWMSIVEPDHEAIRPFDELDATTRHKDEPFLAAIRKAART